MNNSEVSLEALSTWQLVNMVYESLQLETESLINLVLVPAEQEIPKHKILAARLTIKNKIQGLITYLESLLEPDTDFSLNMHSLYGWYTKNLDILLSDAEDLELEKSAKNLSEQANGFIHIWEGVQH